MNDFSSLTSSWTIKLDSKFIKSSKDSDLVFAFNPEDKNSEYYNRLSKTILIQIQKQKSLKQNMRETQGQI